MPISYEMTWIADGRRWRKNYKGKSYTVSCRQLGMPETKEASWRAANEWWERQQATVEFPPEDDRIQRATQVTRLVQDFAKLDEEARKEAVEALLGAGEYDRLKAQRDTVLASLEAAKPERTIHRQIEAWKSLLRAACHSRQMSEARFDAYSRNIGTFVRWIGANSSIDSIDEAKLEEFFNHLSSKVGASEYSPTYAHTLLMTAKQFISRLAEMKLIPMPGNIRSRRFRFNHSAPAKIDVFTVEEVRSMLDAATGRTRLCVLLMLNCGMYQNDIAELRTDEVDWKAGTITRSRSKTRERNGPVVTYKLWRETLTLLREHRAPGELVLRTAGGKPLVKYWVEDEKMRRFDAIIPAWNRLAQIMGMPKHRLGMKHLRKTSATLLGQHPQYKFYGNYFLADSPKGMAERHYMIPSDAEFFDALDWLGIQILGAEGRQPHPKPLLDEQA